MCLSWDSLGRALVFNYSPILKEKQVRSLSDFASTHFFPHVHENRQKRLVFYLLFE